ncbi:MAG: sodium:proton antiporter, partial [Alphaproteobacteria bacterium]|nr:sodium:proton antiporter [Alphaproteobacteria bacterium]
MDSSTVIVQQIAGITTLLTLAAVALAVARRLHVPFALAMIISGVALGAVAQIVPDGASGYLVPTIPPGIILFLFLPALTFEPALQIDLRQLRQHIVPVLTMAVGGVITTAGVVGLAVWWLTPLDLAWSLTLGAIVSAVDPVAVMALFGRLGVRARIIGIMEGETLIGSAVAIVTSRVLVAIALTGAMTSNDMWQGAGTVAIALFGGAVIGWVTALIWGWLLSKSEGDPFVETALTTVLAYASYLAAELMFGTSGVTATLVAGVTLGTWGRTKIYVAVESYLDKFWDFAAAATGATVLLLIGLTVDLTAAVTYWDVILVAIIAMIAARAATVYGLIPAVGLFEPSAKLARADSTAIWWGGMRGTVAAALALSLGAGPYQSALLVTVAAAILFSVLVQGLTLENVIRGLGLERRPLADRIGRDEGLRTAMRRGGRETPELKRGGRFSSRPGSAKGGGLEDDLRALRDEIEGAARSSTEADQERSLLLMRCFQVEHEFFDDVFAKAHLSERAYRDLRYSVTVQAQAVRFNEP